MLKSQINTATAAINFALFDNTFYSAKLENNNFISQLFFLRSSRAQKGTQRAGEKLKKFHIINKKCCFIGNSWMCTIYQKIMVAFDRFIVEV